MKIIGLGHYSATGKDIFADLLLHSYRSQGKTAIKLPFAWKLKQVCHELYSWAGMREPAYYETPEGRVARDVPLPVIGKTPVEVWVAMGTPAVREQVYQNTWIDFVLRTDHGVDVLVIPDVRFPNEVDAIRERDGDLIKVVRPEVQPRDTVADQALADWNGWDVVVHNDGTLFELWQTAQSVAGASRASAYQSSGRVTKGAAA